MTVKFDNEKAEAFLKLQRAVHGGFGGVMPDGKIVDRREFPKAYPMQKNKNLQIPKPKKLPKKDESK